MQIIASWGKKGPGQVHFEKSLTSDGVFQYLCQGWSVRKPGKRSEDQSFLIYSERSLERAEVERRFAEFRAT